MGVTTSKVRDRDIKVGCETPKMDPDKASRLLNVDPRSPTVEIVRTPIQVEQTPDQNPRKLLWARAKPDPFPKLVDEMLSDERDENAKDPECEIEDLVKQNDEI